jgi:hypothetical protein
MLQPSTSNLLDLRVQSPKLAANLQLRSADTQDQSPSSSVLICVNILKLKLA